MAKTLIDQVSNDWLKNTDHSTNLLYWSFKAFIEEKSKNYDWKLTARDIEEIYSLIL